ncbi:MAG: response regulator [Proteobacteria bacterium]|nr:response regulator [Pseudomonadota bacterium]MBU1611111.1 response regulator [Pseudomonadota bacterium]
MATEEHPLKVLIVEDSLLALEQLRLKIENSLGFEVLTARTLAQTKELMDEHGDTIFVAILDLTLPDAPGGEVVDLAEERGIPCIVFTSLFSPEKRQSFLSREVIDYVVKNRRALDEVAYTLNRLRKNRGVKVLLVDDSRSARSYVRVLLNRYMFQVIEAASGQEALETLKKESDIKLVITDFEMEGMNGVDLTSEIRARYSREQLAIIGISARTDKTLSVQFIKQGADDFLDKPFENEEFFCRVLHNVETIENHQRLLELAMLKTRFLSMAAHDLRNPINAIKGFSDLLLSDDDQQLGDDQKEMVGFMNRAANEMDDLVKDLLDISVIESGHLELEQAQYDLAEIIRERVQRQRIPAQRKGIDIQVITDGSLLGIVDGNRVAQVLDNLLTNALKFSPSGTKVTVSLALTQDGAQINVTDQGQGIPPAEQERLFGAFQKLSVRPTAGESSTGLGLAIVKKIVEAHHGSIQVESEPGKGATFSVILPIH